MRVGLAIVLAAAAASCSSQPIILELQPPSGTDHVELMIARDCSGPNDFPCGPGIAWEGLAFQPSGRVMELDRDERIVYPVNAKIEIQPGDKNADRMILLAFDRNDSLLGLLRMDNVDVTQTDQLWKLMIGAVDDSVAPNKYGPEDPPMPSDSTFRAHVWRPMSMPDPTHPSCASTQSWNADANLWDREFYVPRLDHDCDDVMNECNPDWFDYGTIASTQTAYCTGQFPIQPKACVVGHGSCTDGLGSLMCGPPQTGEYDCVPDVLCAECPLLAPGCAASAIANQLEIDKSKVPFATCSFPVDTTSNNGPCTMQSNDTLDLVLPVPCTQIFLFRADTWPATTGAIVNSGMFPVDNMAMVGMALQNATPMCTVDFKWGGGSVMPGVTAQRFILGIANGTGVQIDLPLTIRFSESQTCPESTQPACSVGNLRYTAGASDNDGVWSCFGL